MYLISRNSRMPSWPPSRPKPLCLTPPKGAAGSEIRPRLMPTIPASSASATRMARLRSAVYRYEASPWMVSLARASASPSVSKATTGATGPKISRSSSAASPARRR